LKVFIALRLYIIPGALHFETLRSPLWNKPKSAAVRSRP